MVGDFNYKWQQVRTERKWAQYLPGVLWGIFKEHSNKTVKKFSIHFVACLDSVNCILIDLVLGQALYIHCATQQHIMIFIFFPEIKTSHNWPLIDPRIIAISITNWLACFNKSGIFSKSWLLQDFQLSARFCLELRISIVPFPPLS